MPKLQYFSKNTTNMGYRPPPVVDISYAVTVSNETILVDNNSDMNIDFSYNSILFSQYDSSNKNKLFAFTRWKIPNTPYTNSLNIMGEPGRSSSYVYYDASSTVVRDLVYDCMDVSGDAYTLRYPIVCDASSLFLAQTDDLSFSITNNSNIDVSYEIIGNFDLASFNSSGTLSSTPVGFQNTLGAHGDIAIHLHNKPYFKRYVPYQTFVVTVSGDKFFIGAEESPMLYTSTNGNYLFDQTHSSNTDYPLQISTSTDGSEYTATVSKFGIPGSTGYTLVTTNSAQDLHYYSPAQTGMGNTFYNVTIDVSYVVRVETNALNESVYAFYDVSDGEYYKQPKLGITYENDYNKVYYFDTSDSSNSGEMLAFGTSPEGSPFDNYTSYSAVSQGSSGSHVYLDLREYFFSAVTIRSMDFSPFTKAYKNYPFIVSFANGYANDGSFNVVDSLGSTVSLVSPLTMDLSYGKSEVSLTMNITGGIYNIEANGIQKEFELVDKEVITYVVTVVNDTFYLNNVMLPEITFLENTVYVFDQSDASNSGNRILFGPEYDNSSNVVSYQTTYGTVGNKGAYTILDIDSTVENAFYFSNTGNVYGYYLHLSSSSIEVSRSTTFTVTAINYTSVNHTLTITGDLTSSDLNDEPLTKTVPFGNNVYTYTTSSSATYGTMYFQMGSADLQVDNVGLVDVTMTTSGKITFTDQLTLSYYMVAGGRGGSGSQLSGTTNYGGTGGYNGENYSGSTTFNASTYTVTIGSGGSGMAAYSTDFTPTYGGNTSISGVKTVAQGGGSQGDSAWKSGSNNGQPTFTFFYGAGGGRGWSIYYSSTNGEVSLGSGNGGSGSGENGSNGTNGTGGGGGGGAANGGRGGDGGSGKVVFYSVPSNAYVLS